MEQQIQDLIASIRKDGLDAAKAESDRIIEEARKEAEKILSDASLEAERIVSDAEAKAKLEADSSISSIKQAARDASIALKKRIEEQYTSILKDAASEAMKGEALSQMIAASLSADAQGKDIEISSSDTESVRKSLSKILGEKIASGIDIRLSNSVDSGFRIVEKDGSGYVDCSADECVSLIWPFLSEKIREILG